MFDNKIYEQKIQKATDYLKINLLPVLKTKLMFVLGSGYNHIVDKFKIIKKIAYKDIPNFPVCTAKWHQGYLVLGEFNDMQVLFMQGRHHYFEGYNMHEIAFPIYVLRRLGIERFLACNAAASLNPNKFKINTMCLLTDHISFFKDNPVVGLNNPKIGIRCPIPQELYNKKQNKIIMEIAKKNNLPLEYGVFLGYPGGLFETPAEAKMFKNYADMIGMSIIPEAIAAFHCGMSVSAISTATIYALGQNNGIVDDDLIIERTKVISEYIFTLLKETSIIIKQKK